MARSGPLRLLSFSVLLAVLAAGAHAGVPADALIGLGDRFYGQLSSPDDSDLLAFDGLAGELLSVTVRRQGSDGALARATLLDEALQVVDTSAFEKQGGKSFRLRKVPLPATGRFHLRLSSLDGSTGAYKVVTRGRFPKSLRRLTAEVAGPAGPLPGVPFDALPGTLLTGRLRPAKGSAAAPALETLLTPGGSEDVSAAVTVKGTSLRLAQVLLGAFGTYGLAPLNTAGPGALVVRLKLRFPKPSKSTHVEPPVGPGDPGTLAGRLAVKPVAVLLESEPNDSPDESQFVGLMAPGRLLRIRGVTSDAPQPPFGDLGDLDAFRLRIDRDQTLFLSLLHDADTAATDFDLEVYEPPVDAGEPPLAVFASDPPSEPESGQLAITGVTAPFDLDLVVRPTLGQGSYLLTLRAGAPPPVPPSSALSIGGWPGVTPPVARLAARPAALGRDGAALPPAGLPGHGPGAAAGPAVAGALIQPGATRRAAYGESAADFTELELLVRLADPARDPRTWAAGHGLSVRLASPSGWCVVRADHLAGTGDAAWRRHATRVLRDGLRRDPALAAVDLDHRHQADAGPSPSDPFLPLQWHYPLMGLNAAWTVTTGSPDVLVAILDTGITAHPDLLARDTGTGWDMISSPSAALDGNGVDADPTDPGDRNNPDGSSSWHGTHVAGTVGATTDNGQGVAGVDQACGLMHVRVLGKGGGSSFDIAEAVRYAAGLPNASGTTPPRRADVINLSLGSPADNAALAAALFDARAQGVVLVAAAGNADSNEPHYPASNAGVLSVAATDLLKQRAPYSNTGPMVDVAAPGGDTSQDLDGNGFPDGVLSTIFDEPSDAFAFAFHQGTSMAAPHVAGLAALLLSLNGGLTPDVVEAVLQATAEDLGAPGRDDLYGHGLVDALAAVQAVAGGAASDPLLVLSSTALAFGSQQETLLLGVSNAGGGTLSFGASVSEDTGSGWLTVSVVEGGGTTGSAPATLQVTVDRGGLAPGAYSGQVLVAGNGGASSVAVSMDVVGASSSFLDLGPIHVLAVDPQDLAPVGQATVTAEAADWLLADLPPGSWLLAAGPDLDGDGFICGEGEPCGLYPTLGEPVLVGVDPLKGLTGLDFAVSDALVLPGGAQGSPAPFLPPGGLRLLHK